MGLAAGRMLTPGPASSGREALLKGKKGRNCLSVLVGPEDNPGWKALGRSSFQPCQWDCK